jgi:hypothetical protein
MRNIEKIIDIIKGIEGKDTDYAVAKILSVDPSYINNWKKRETIPYKILLSYCESRGLILNTLLTGSGHLYKHRVKFNDNIISKLLKSSALPSERTLGEKLGISLNQYRFFYRSGLIPLQILEVFCSNYNVDISRLLGSVKYSEIFETIADNKILEVDLELKKRELKETKEKYKELGTKIKKLFTN